MMSQYRCSQPEPYKPWPWKSESIIQGFQYTFRPDGILKDKLQLAKLILEHALDNVCNLGGTMVISFPDSTPAIVSVITKQYS